MKKSLNHQNFSLLPTYKGSGLVPEDGLTQPLSSFCKRKFNEKCKAHYRNLKDGKSMCPYGFSSYQFTLDGKKSNWTGIKVKGAYSSGDVKIRSSAQGFKVYTDKDLQFLQLETRKLINKLNTIFDSKIENEKGNLDYSKKFTENAFHEIRPLNGKIKAAINQSKSMIGSQKANLGQDYNQIVNHLTTIAMCSDIATARMDARDLLTNPSSVRLGSERRINLKKEIKALGNLFKTILKKDEIDLVVRVNEKVQLKTYEAFKIVLFVLTENAIKYTPANIGQEIEVKFKKDGQNVFLLFSSFGPLILDHEIEKIFEPFYRGENVESDDGQGVGLYAAATILSQLDMTIAVNQTDRIIPFNDNEYVETIFTVKAPLSTFRENRFP